MIVALTGHRPNKLWGYDLKHPNYQTLAKTLRKYVLDLKADRIITGMALGADTVWAFVGLNIREKFNPDLQIEAAIPCRNHSSKWTTSSQQMYDRILSQCDEVTLVSDCEYTPSCMQERNRYMVDNCDVLIAVWDGTNGGTANCVKYAQLQNKQIIYINPKIGGE